MICIDREITTAALERLVKFHEETKELFARHGMDLLSDLGRRNTLMSTAQEKFFTDELRARGYSVRNDGRGGQPDIMVDGLQDGSVSEIECKLTTRNSYGGIILQTDYTTLQRKGWLDYLYVIADVDFQSFAVLYFQRLTSQNFRTPSNGSRGKAGMLKHTCYDRCLVLHGKYTHLNERHIERITSELAGPVAKKRREKLEKKLEYWRSHPGQFEVELESL